MKKNLFLAGALALFATVGVSAQEWCRTLATGTEGEQITHEVNGAEVTQYRAETALIKNAGAKGVRYTVMQTGALNQLKRVGPCFAIGEIFVLDAAGDTIDYTVTSNAGHNELTGGTDGAGLPAVNDGNLNNFFHTVWNDDYAIDEYHYLELTFEKTVDEFKLVWYTRPNQHQNRPLIIGLSNPGVKFTDSMLFAEYGFELGNQVTTAEDIAKGGTFAFYVEGPAEFGETKGNGNTYISLSGYTTGSSAVAGPQNIVQFIPGADGKFVLYQPVLDTYYADPSLWTDGYNGKNGWLRAYNEARTLAKFDIVPTGNGDFEITTEVTQRYIDGAWVKFDEPLKVWVGYDMRGNLKIFPQDVKGGLEKEDYTLGFGLPVNFGFDIYAANVNKELVPDLTIGQMCNEVIGKTLKIAEDKWALYEEYMEDYDWYYAADTYAEAMAAAEEALATEDLANVFEANKTVEAAIAQVVAVKANYYSGLIGELEAEVNENYAGYPYKKEDEGKYTSASKDLLDNALNQVTNIIDNSETLSYTAIENALAVIQASLDQLEGTKLTISTLPQVVKDIPADVFSTDHPNNAVWKQRFVVDEECTGVRLTILDRHIGSAADGGNFPMVAIGEINVYDADGKKMVLDSTCFEANYTETKEGFASTVARLCDGNYGAQGYYHSPWSGAEPQEYIWIDIDFPGTDAHQVFTLEVFSRDRSTTMGRVSLFPKKVAITEVGSPYKPLLYVENPYNVTVGNKITSVDQIKADGLYVIKGFLNTQSVLAFNEDSMIVDTDPVGAAMFYHGFDRFHASAQAVRAQGVYRFVPNGDGTFKPLSLGAAKYWPSTEETGFISGTYKADEAANLKIVPSNNIEGAFVMYEFHEGLTTGGDSIDTNGDDVADSTSDLYQTPYVVYMDWANSVAARPVVDPQPFRDPEGNIRDAQGDALCFNKANGEGEWEIYEVTMDNPDFFWLTNMTNVIENLGLVRGTNPGCVSDLGALGTALENAEQIVADSAYADAPAAAVALAKEIAAVDSLKKNPMVEGVYQVVSAEAGFMKNQKVEKALYATVNGSGTSFGWKSIEEDNIEFYFAFEKSETAEDLVAADKIKEEQADLVYSIRAIATYVEETPYYVSKAKEKSKPFTLVSQYPVDYLVLNNAGSTFNLKLAEGAADFCIHANEHGGGTGQSGNIVYWDGTAGASQWYLRKVDYETSIDNFVTEGTEVVAVSYFTPAGAAVPAPVQGINIVVTVYANGVVETKKVLVK